jgi:hypothetical protein
MTKRTGMLARIAEQVATIVVVYVLVMITLLVWSPWTPAEAKPKPAAVATLVVIRAADGTVLATYADEAAMRWNLVNDNVRLRRELQDLKEAVDYDVVHAPGTVGPSVHEFADGAAPGAYGGGRKP